MAYGPAITLTHAGASSTPILITDIRDYTDGPAYAAGDPAGGGVYVPESSSRTLTYTASVARSYENGAIRQFIDNGEITVAWSIGTEFADAFSHTERFQSGIVANDTESLTWIAPTACKVLSISAYATTAPASAGGTYTLAVDGGGNNLLGAATFDLEGLTDATVEALTLTSTTADLTLSADDVVKLDLVSNNADLTGDDLVIVIEWAHR